MNKDQLISKQQLEIEELKAKLAAKSAAEADIRSLIYCVSGPLNGNVKAYTADQMRDFHKIIACLNEAS